MELAGTDKKSIFLKKPKLLYIGAYRPKAGWMRSLHAHDFCEVMFIKEGSGLFKVDETEYPVKRATSSPAIPASDIPSLLPTWSPGISCFSALREYA